MAYVTPIYGGSAAQIDYRLGITQHGCSSDTQFAYHADGRERPLRWIGHGLPAFGVDGVAAGAELTEEQNDLARALMAGRHIATGEQLVAPKVAVPADAKVPLGPLVAAVKAAAAERGIEDPAGPPSPPPSAAGRPGLRERSQTSGRVTPRPSRHVQGVVTTPPLAYWDLGR
jgi:hypothetical protein